MQWRELTVLVTLGVCRWGLERWAPGVPSALSTSQHSSLSDPPHAAARCLLDLFTQPPCVCFSLCAAPLLPTTHFVDKVYSCH